MEAEAAQVVEDNGSAGKRGGGVELFYEDIEAPKFVDFTDADHYNPDDRYWFCARVGCDQRHEQEINLEEINKNFILRVMAARSPYVKFRRTVTDKTINSSTTTRKCPLTAPSKHSRPRMSRLVVLSSISRKLLDGNERPVRSANPITASTPKQARAKTLTAANSNALTTSRCKSKAVKPELFRSARNPKKREEAADVSSEEEQNNRMVPKALVFNSPKKKKKVIVEPTSTTTDDASVRKMCRGMKKLDINGGQRLHPPSKVGGASSRKKMGAREVKSRVYEALKPQTCKKGKENDSLLRKRRHVEEKQEEETEGFHGSISLVVCHGSSSSLGGESSDMEVDENSNLVPSVDKCSVESSELFEVPIVQDCLIDLRNKLSIQVEPLHPSWDVEGEVDVTDKEKENVESEDREKSPKEQKRDVVGDHCGNTLTAGSQNEYILATDDKENTSALDHHNREQNTESGRNILGKQQHGKSQKARIISKEATADVKSGHGDGGKYSKPRPTNPKPFRLRTDERRVLKEANLEKKLLLTPLKEMNSVAVAAVISNGSSSSLRKKKGGGHRPSVSSSPAQERVRKTKQQALSRCVTPSRNTEKRQLSVIKEMATLNLKTAAPMKKKSEDNTNKSAAVASGDSSSRSVSRGRIQRHTIPREPHFHTVSVPKTCCTKKWV